jgi:hypothetical protein
MTVLRAPHDAWAKTFCPACHRIVQFQAEDVVATYTAADNHGATSVMNQGHSVGRVVHMITCTCGAPIVVGT